MPSERAKWFILGRKHHLRHKRRPFFKDILKAARRSIKCWIKVQQHKRLMAQHGFRRMWSCTVFAASSAAHRPTFHLCHTYSTSRDHSVGPQSIYHVGCGKLLPRFCQTCHSNSVARSAGSRDTEPAGGTGGTEWCKDAQRVMKWLFVRKGLRVNLSFLKQHRQGLPQPCLASPRLFTIWPQQFAHPFTLGSEFNLTENIGFLYSLI